MQLIQKPKKSLGQNFLIDKNIINKIIKVGNIDRSKTIIEIGSGYGNLTECLSQMNPKKIFAIEKDKKLSFFLKEKFKNYKNIKVINKDILSIIENSEINKGTIIFGNLPYNISTKILSSLITLKKWPPQYDLLIFMFQKEVADRIIAKSHTKEYGRLAVLANWRLEIKKHFEISKYCFIPKPKVNSTLLSFKPKKNVAFDLISPKTLETVTRVLFSSRRKMINKNFKKLFNNKVSLTHHLNIDLKKRPEELSYEKFYEIAYTYEKLFS